MCDHVSVGLEMGSHDQQVDFDSGGSQQTRLSGFFKTVYSKFSGSLPLSKKDPGAEDVVITSQVMRKKPLLVIGNFTENVAPPEAESRLRDNTHQPSLPATVCSNVNEVDSKKGIAIIQVAQTAMQHSVLSVQTSENCVVEDSNRDAAKQPSAGAGTKRKATEVEVCGHRTGYSFPYFNNFAVPNFR